MAKRKAPASAGVPEWVVTYGDLMSLLLCFFILLAAFSELKQERDYQDVVRSVQEAFGYQGGIGQVNSDDPPLQSFVQKAVELMQAKKGMPNTSESRSPAPAGPDPTSSALAEGQRTVVGTEIVFAPGSAELTVSMREYITSQIIPKLRGLRFKTEVRGHAFGREDRAAGGDLDAMSYQRAKAVKDYLVAQGIPAGQLSVTAVGSAEPKSINVGSTTAMAANRRVQIIMTETIADDAHPDPNFTRPEAR
jgi:chemotaxis protein MotB